MTTAQRGQGLLLFLREIITKRDGHADRNRTSKGDYVFYGTGQPKKYSEYLVCIINFITERCRKKMQTCREFV